MARFEFDPYPTVAPQSIPLASENIQSSPAMFGGLIAGAEEKLGQGMESAGQAGLAYLQARDTLNNEVHANDLLTNFAKQGTAEWEKFQALEGQAAVNALPAFQRRLDDIRQQMLAGENLQVRSQLSRGLSLLMDRYYGWAAGHAGSQERKWHDQSAADGAMTFGAQASLSALNAKGGDWTQVDQDLHASDERVATLWRQKNPSLDPESRGVIDAEVAKNRGKNVKYIVETLVNQGRIADAQAILDRYKGGMDAASLAAATAALKAKQHDEASRLRGGDAAESAIAATRGLTPTITGVRDDAAVALAKQGITLDVTSGYRTPEHNAEVGGARGSQHLHGRAIDVSLNGLTPDQQQKVIDQFLSDPRVGGFGYYPRSNSIHVDVRPGGRTAWGSDYHATSIGEGWPDWMTAKVRSWQGSAAPRPDIHDEYGPLDRAGAYNRLIGATEGDPLAQAYGITRLNQIYSVERDERTADSARFNQRINDTLAEAGETGVVDPMHLIGEAEFLRNKRPGESDDDARVRYEAYIGEVQFRSDRNAMESMPAEEMRSMVEGNQPTATSPGGWAAAAQRYERLRKTMDEIITNRRKDPAAAVAKDPTVMAALRHYDPRHPETFAPVAQARLAAQAQLGINPEFRFPLTREEGQREAGPIYRALPGQEAAAVTAVWNRFQAMYGIHAPDALAYAMAQGHEDQQSREYAAAIMTKFLHDPASTAARRQYDQDMERLAAERAAMPLAPPAEGPKSPPPANPPPAATGPVEGPPSAPERRARTPENTPPPAVHAEQDAARQREQAAQELESLASSEASRTFPPHILAQHDQRRAAIFAKFPDLKAPYEAAQARRPDIAATEKFTSEMDALAAKDATIRSRVLPTAAARHMAGQREHAFDAEISAIASSRQALIVMERNRLGIRSDKPFTWPADRPFPATMDIVALMHNAGWAAKFDAKYGQGAADMVLGRD